MRPCLSVTDAPTTDGRRSCCGEVHGLGALVAEDFGGGELVGGVDGVDLDGAVLEAPGEGVEFGVVLPDAEAVGGEFELVDAEFFEERDVLTPVEGVEDFGGDGELVLGVIVQ